MTGQAQPPRLVEPFAKNAVVCTPEAPVAGGKTFPFPQPSQISILTGAASLDDGFVPLNMTDPASGGVPPFGVDMNGILFYLSSWCAYFAAGQIPFYDATLQAFMGGYAEGAVLSKAAIPWETWTSVADANMTDPDTGGAGWLSSVPLYSAAALTGVNDVVLPGVSDYTIDVNTTSSSPSFTGFVAQRDGQTITFRNTGTGTITLVPLSTSSAHNQISLSTGGITILQNDTFTIRYVTAINLWVQA